MSRLQMASREETRRQLLAMALRDTLRRNGLSVDCITAEALPGITAGRERGMHVQLVFRDGQLKLLSYLVALEAAFKATLRRLDPLSTSWMAGISWRFEPKDAVTWPQLPAVRERRAADPVQSVKTPARPRATLETLLHTGDAAFRERVAPADFSPTLPMHRR